VDYVLQNLDFVGLAHQRIELGAYFALSGRRNLVVVHFGRYAHVLECQTHRRADVVQRVDGRYRKVAALDGWPVTGVAFLEAAVSVPRAFVRVDLVERTLHRVIPGDVIKHEELVLRPEVRSVSNAGRLQVRLGAAGQRTRAAVVALHRRGLDDVASQIDGRFVRKHIDNG
jgi:hypothetical protein